MFSMEKRVYKNRIRVVFAYKMVTKAYWVEKLGMSKMKINRWRINIMQSFDSLLIAVS